jgi:hypothetical protein
MFMEDIGIVSSSSHETSEINGRRRGEERRGEERRERELFLNHGRC